MLGLGGAPLRRWPCAAQTFPFLPLNVLGSLSRICWMLFVLIKGRSNLVNCGANVQLLCPKVEQKKKEKQTNGRSAASAQYNIK